MPDVVIRTTRFATPTSTGNVDVTTADLGGKTPKAVIIIASHADTDGTAEDGLALGVGFADATLEGSANISSQHAQTTTSTRRRFRTVLVIDLLVGATAQVTANFVSFITNGVRLNFTAVDSDAQLFTVIFFAGDDLSAHSDSIDLGTGTSALDQTAPGFQPDLVFVAGCAITANTQSGVAIFHFGVAVRDGSDTNRGISWSSANALGTSAATLQMHTDSIGGEITTSQIWEASIDSFDASGFSITPSANAGNDVVIYLAISVGGLSAWVGSLDSPTSTGDDAQTGPGFKPQFVMLGMTAAQAEDTVESDADAGPIGFSVFDKDGNEFSTAVVEEDAVTTTNNQSLADNQAVNFPNDAGTQIMAATFSTMDANGWTLNFSVADGTARKWFGVAIEEVVAPDIEEWAGTLGFGQQEPIREKNEIVEY